MTIYLDCESIDSTLLSLSTIFNCDEQELSNALQSIVIRTEIHSIDDIPDTPYNIILYNHITKLYGEPNCTEYIAWFHITRTNPSNTFERGILPLSEAHDIITNEIINAVNANTQRHNLLALLSDGIHNTTYQIRTTDSFHSGPYAVLIKETAFISSSIGQHDYLELPEIIEDICSAYEERFGESIRDEVIEYLSPCIVKFHEYTVANTGNISTALCYAYSKLNDKPITISSVDCFDGNNTAIHQDDIVEIDFINDEE